MGMAQQREPSRSLALTQPVAQVGNRATVVGIALQQGCLFLVCCGQVLLQQPQLAGKQEAVRIAGLAGFPFQLRQ